MTNRNRRVAASLLVASCVGAAFGVPTFRVLGRPPGGTSHVNATEISGDGSTVVGWVPQFQRAFRWNETDGYQLLSSPVGGGSYAEGVSYDGSVVVGSAGSSSFREAFRWTAATGMVSLGDFPGNQRNGVANGVSADGSVVVGYGSSERSRMIEGFRWTAETGLVPLGSVNPNHIYSAATDVSADGQVVAGYSYNGTGFRWTAGEGMVPIGGWGTAAWAISADGTAIVGTHAPNGHTQPYRWTVETGIVSLGRPAGFIDALGLDVSADGSIVVGRGNGNQNDGSHALIWDADHGNRRLDGVLAGEYGLDLGDYELISADSVSADGMTIMGSAVGPDELWVPFIATIPEPSTVMLLILLAAGARKASR